MEKFKLWFLDGWNWYWKRLKRTKIWKLWTSLFFMIIFLSISRAYFNVWFWIACIFAIYPAITFVLLFIYGWILNPIREAFPNSKFTKKFLKKLDKIVLEWDSFY